VGKESGRGRKGKREIGQERGLWKKNLTKVKIINYVCGHTLD
jgi:hypothetical protein